MAEAIILVIIVNYRTTSLTIDALRSLEPEIARYPGSRAIVIDNGSADGSAEAIGNAIRAFGDWCTIEALSDNRGFAAGNNAALALAAAQGFAPDLIWLLNPDTRVLPGTLKAFTRFMGAHPDAGIVGGGTEEPDGKPQHSAFRFPSPQGEIDAAIGLGLARRLLHRHVIAPALHDQPTKVDWVTGANMMIRHTALDRIGGFDDGYFLYYEETDFCRRAADAGIACWHEPAARVVHLVGKSTGINERKRRPRYWFDSRARYYRKHLGAEALIAANIGWLVAYPIGCLLDLLRGRPRLEAQWLWWDMLKFGWGNRKILPGTGRGTAAGGGGAARDVRLPLHHAAHGPPPRAGED